MAFPVGWTKKHKITIDHTKVSATLTNFPVALIESNFLSEIFANTDNGGGDIRFSSDEAGTTQLPCEIVIFNTGTSSALVFVKVPSISSSVDTVIYVWYGKTGETQPVRTNAFGSDNVWDANFVRVLHFNNNGFDSTSNNLGVNTNNGVVYSASGGILKGSATWDENDSLIINDHATIDFSTALTLEAWAKPTTFATHHRMIFAKDDHFLNSARNVFGLALLTSAGQVYGGVTDAASTNADSSAGNASTGVYNYIGLAWDTTDRYAWLNATFGSTGTDAITTLRTNADNLYIGKNNDGTDPYGYAGGMAEIRLSNIKRSQAWLGGTFNNVSAPATFSAPSAIATDVDDERETEIHGKLNVDDDRDTEVHGSLGVNNERDSETTGSLISTSQRQSEITGIKYSDERESELYGIENAVSERESEVTGGLGVNNERESEVIGSMPFSERDTEITGKAELAILRTYRILVKDGSGVTIGEFDKFRALKFGKRLNNYGTASFEIPVNDQKAALLVSLRVYTVWIYMQEDAATTLVWSGEQAFRSGVLDSAGNNWATIHCFTWLEQLSARFTADFVEFDTVDAGEIAWSLIDTTQTQTNGDFGITEGSIEATIDRVRHYYNDNVMEMIINLGNVLSGFDHEITDLKVFNVASVLGTDKTNSIVFEYGHNVVSVRIDEDFVTPVNRAIVLGEATDETTLQRVDTNDAGLQATYKVREGLLNEMDISEAATFTDKGEAMIRKYGTALFKLDLTLAKTTSPDITQFGLGDIIRIKIKTGIYDIDTEYRVFEYEMTYADDNSETLSLILGNFTL